MRNIRPTFEQEHAISMILSGSNVFLTGHAGTGKSTVLELLRRFVGEKAVFLAPTGIAALNIQGSTINSFFKLPPCPLAPDFATISDDRLIEKIRRASVFVIDEASMVRSDLLAAVDTLCRTAASWEESYLPFGGKQVVLVGDFAQLPPVVLRQTEEFIRTVYGGKFGFDTAVWRHANFVTVRLTEVWRQSSDAHFVKLLNALRSVGSEHEIKPVVDLINASVHIGEPEPDATVLCPTRAQVDAINYSRDSSVANPAICFNGQVWENFQEDMLASPIHLRLKVGSRVIVTANIPTVPGGIKVVNGDTGMVTGMDSQNQLVEVALDDGRHVRISPFTWLNSNYILTKDPLSGDEKLDQQIIGTYTQIPLKLAYAMTIHKSQGLTLDKVHLELGNGMFAEGQLYTALSRARSLAGLSLDRPLRPSDVLFSPRVVEFCKMVDCTLPPPNLREPGWHNFPFPVGYSQGWNN